MVDGFVDSLLHDALECADLAQDGSQAVLSLPDFATQQAQKLVNAQPETKLTIKNMSSAQHYTDLYLSK